MNTFALASLFLPAWALPWVVILGIAAWILGARSLAALAFLTVIADLVLAPLLAPWIARLPDWAVYGIIILVGLMVFNSTLAMLFGPEVAGHVVGTWLIRILDVVLLGPFRLFRSLFRNWY